MGRLSEIKSRLLRLKKACPTRLSIQHKTGDFENVRSVFDDVISRQQYIIEILDQMVMFVEFQENETHFERKCMNG